MRNAKSFLAPSIAAAFLWAAGSALLGICGPFTDFTNAQFCPYVLEIFTLGITTGTTPTTYDPASPVSRLQMAAFLSRSVDGLLKRGSRHAAMRRFWTTQGETNLGLTTVGDLPVGIESDGQDIWAAGATSVSRVGASDGKRLGVWTGAANGRHVLSTMGKIFVTASTTPGRLYRIDPSQAAGAVTTVASNLGTKPDGIAFDGSRIWTANIGDGTPGTGSVSIVTPGAAIPWAVTSVSLGFSQPRGALYDGASIWVTDQNLSRLFKLDSAGAILQTVTVGLVPGYPAFDGANIWVPNSTAASVSVVRASNGTVLATLTGNGMSGPRTAAFDGQRILVTNFTGDSVSLWKAADLAAIGSFPTGTNTDPTGACSDGINLWVALSGSDNLARF